MIKRPPLSFKTGFLFLGIIILSSCSPLEVARLLGVGTKPFKTQGKTYNIVLGRDYFSAYDQIKESLNALKAKHYRGNRKKGFIIAINFQNAYKECSNSTEVAIFFEEVSLKETKIEVVSLNHGLGEFVATELFKDFAKDETLD